MAIRCNKVGIRLIFIILVGSLLVSCASESTKRERIEVDVEKISVDDAVKAGVQSARQIFYSLPSPLETAMILKRSGAEYNPEILNPVENISSAIPPLKVWR
jgi:hypothetical protein